MKKNFTEEYRSQQFYETPGMGQMEDEDADDVYVKKKVRER